MARATGGTDVATTDDTSQEVAVPDDVVDGLEDLDDSDETIPRFGIDHDEGKFVNLQTKEMFDEFDAIILGLVKQRVLWPPEPGPAGEGPMCRAVNFKTGVPDAPKWVVKHNGQTAVDVSGFTFDEVEAGNLDCNSCGNKEWESHPKSGAPWCNEQFTFPIIQIREDGTQVPALMSFSRTGLKPCRTYVSGFKQSKRPLYTVVTRITAVVQNNKGRDYVTPEFSIVEDTDPTDFPRFSQSLAAVKQFITTPRSFDADESTPSGNVNTAPAAAKPAAKPEPEPEPEPEPPAEETDEEREVREFAEFKAAKAAEKAEAVPAEAVSVVADDEDEPF